jgi:hypothetical protein
MFFQHRSFWLSKDVQHPDEYQDSCHVDARRGIAAIADGVSSSLFAASWAKLLSRAIVADPPDVTDAIGLPEWLNKLREAWLKPIQVDSLPWHQKARFQAGASSTLLWVELYVAEASDPTATGPVQLYAYAVGDCCLFHIRNDQLLRSFPLDKSELFDTDPNVVSSVNRQKDHLLQFETLVDYCQDGDLLVLCTDAIAAWTLAQSEAGSAPSWEAYWNISEEGWRNQIHELRQQHKIRYDDSTVLMLRIGGP